MWKEGIKQRIKFAKDKGKRRTAITQTFDSMVDNGLYYGYTNGGYALILLFRSSFFTLPEQTDELFNHEKVILAKLQAFLETTEW